MQLMHDMKCISFMAAVHIPSLRPASKRLRARFARSLRESQLAGRAQGRDVNSCGFAVSFGTGSLGHKIAAFHVLIEHFVHIVGKLGGTHACEGISRSGTRPSDSARPPVGTIV